MRTSKELSGTCNPGIFSVARKQNWEKRQFFRFKPIFSEVATVNSVSP